MLDFCFACEISNLHIWAKVLESAYAQHIKTITLKLYRMSNSKTYLCATVLATLFMACNKDSNLMTTESPEEVSYSNQIPEGISGRNPYSLSVMQQAVNSLLRTRSLDTIVLSPTDYYIRIASVDTLSIKTVQRLEDIELFDYPLDRDYEEESEYCFDPDQPVEAPTWTYTAVPVKFADEDVSEDDINTGTLIQFDGNKDFVPKDSDEDSGGNSSGNDSGGSKFKGEILDECYIPSRGDLTKACGIDAEELERRAFEIVGAKYESDDVTRASNAKPSGVVKLNTGTSTVPLKGVKVRVQRFLKWAVQYTDENGKFAFNSKYYRPNISVIFENTKGFSIWGSWVFVVPASYTYFWCGSPDNFSKTFTRSKDYSAWSWSVVNNAAYEYYKECSSGAFTGVKTPPAGLKFWCVKIDVSGASGSTPMMRYYLNDLFPVSNVKDYLSNLFTGHRYISIGDASLVRSLAADIYLFGSGFTYEGLYTTTVHELCHASHFRSLGKSLYGKLIAYEVKQFLSGDGCYGDGSEESIGCNLCGLSEAYAYSVESYIWHEEFSGDDIFGTDYFFSEYVLALTDIFDDAVLTPGQVFKCMTFDMSNLKDLFNKLKNSYPDKSDIIKSIMEKHGL